VTDNSNAFLGTGWSFPPTFPKGRGVELVSAEEDIYQSLQILLSTELGERVLQPTYGCNLTELLFDPLNPTVASNIRENLRLAILYHEPRIRLNGLDLKSDPEAQGVVLISVDYTIVSTNSRFNFVYPFYLQEGANPAP